MNVREYWRQLQPREQTILLAGGGAAVILLFYALVWDPFMHTIRQTEQSVADQQATLAWMQHAAHEITSLRGRQPGGAAHDKSLLSLVDETTRSQGLAKTVKKVQPDGQHGVRIWLDDAQFDTVLQWLDTLTRGTGVTVTGFSAERGSSDNLVSVKLSLKEGQ